MHQGTNCAGPGTIFDDADIAVLDIEHSHMIQEGHHLRINVEVVRHRSQDDVAVLERIGNEVARISLGDVVHMDVGHAFSARRAAKTDAALSVLPYMEA